MKIKKTNVLCGVLILLTTSCLTQYPLNKKINIDKECRILSQKRQVVSKRKYSLKRNSAKYASITKFKGTKKSSAKYTGINKSEGTRKGVSKYPEMLNGTSGVEKKTEYIFPSGLPEKIIFEPADRNPAIVEATQPAVNRAFAEHKIKVRQITLNKIHNKPKIIPSSHKKNSDWQDNNVVPVLVGLSGLLSVALLSSSRKRSRAISKWASVNPWKARGIITGTQITVALSALIAGNHLYEQRMMITEAAKNSAMIIFATSSIFYPFVNSRFRLFKSSYIRQKIHDVALFSSGTLLMISLGNHYSISPEWNSPISKASYSFENFNHPANAFHVMMKDSSTPEYKQDPPAKMSTAAKIALLVLALGAFGGLAYLLALLSCSIACGGSEGLAYIVFFGGGIGLLTLLVLSIRGIFGKHKKQRKPPVEINKNENFNNR